VLNQPASPSNTTKPTFSGTASDPERSVVVHIFDAGHSPVTTATASGTGGGWAAGNEASLASGTYTAIATQESSLGNAPGESSEVTFTIDTSSPTVVLNQPASPSNTTKPTFSGTASDPERSVVVEIFDAGHAKVASASASGGGGEWSSSSEPSLASGSYTAVATQASSLGNPAGKSNQVAFTVDTVSPLVSLTPGSAEKHTATPKLEGTAGTASGDLPTVTLNIYTGSSPAGTPVRVSSVVAKSGKWSVVPSAALQNGTYTARAEQADEAGNHGLSAPTTFTISSNGPVVTLTPLAVETSNASPSFSGSAGLAGGEVRLQVYSGPHASGNVAVRKASVTATGSSWSSGAVTALPDGTYTAIAEESDHLGNIGVSGEATFTVDTVAPGISLTSPGNGSSASGESQVVEGLAGTQAGDAATIVVRLASGNSIDGQALQTRVVANEGGHWHVDFAGLAPGAYATEAEQADAAGNSALSQAVTFTLTAPPSGRGSPPAAAFTWLPSSPRVGEVVSLLSSSSDSTSPINGYAWDLADTGVFSAGAATNVTTFSTGGDHVVHMRVSAADGLSSVASETISVLPARYALMQPFPIVRIASIDTRSGIRLKLLRVQAPNGSRISVSCHNRGCPARSQQKLAAAAAKGVATYSFHKFERALRAGVMLEIRVSAVNQIGKYTRLTIRKGRLPQRVDLCLGPGGAKTIVCPA
jgi:hypothetical protein